MHVVAEEPQPAGVGDDEIHGEQGRNQRQQQLEGADLRDAGDDDGHDDDQPDDDGHRYVAHVVAPYLDPVHVLEEGSGFLHVGLNVTFEVTQDELVDDHPRGDGR